MKKWIFVALLVGLVVNTQAFAQKRAGNKEKNQKEVKSEDKVQKAGEVKAAEVPQVQKKSVEERANIITQSLVETLKLNADQTRKVHAANVLATKKIDELRENRQEKAKTFKTEIKAAYDERDMQIKAALTPEQVKLYEESKTKFREKRNNK